MFHFSRVAILLCSLIAIVGLSPAPARAQNLLCTLTSTVTGTNSTACGSLSVVNGNYSLAAGYVSSVTGSNAAAFGAYSFAGGDNSLALGAHAVAANASPYNGISNATAVGAYSTAGVGATAVGQNSTASATDAIAFGHSAFANQSLALALGSYATVTVANGVAIGPNASVTAAGSVAIGSGSLADVANTVSVGAVGSERKIVNLASGTLSSASRDAVNGSQLFATNSNVTANTSAITANTAAIATANTNLLTANQRIAAAFGGGSSVDANGIVTAPSYSVQGQTFNNAGAAFGALDTQVTSNTAAIASNTTSITNLGSQLSSGTIGIVRQDAVSRTVSVGKTTDGTIVDFAGSAGSRKLTGVLSGTVSSSSTDAINGAQLSATNTQVVTNTSAIASQATAMATATSNFATANQRIAAAFGGGSSVDASGIVTAPSYSVQGQTFNNAGGAFGALDSRVTSNTSDIASINSQLTIGGIGLVRQDSVTRNLSVASATDGTLIDVTGTAGARKLTGVRAGTVSAASLDAVNGAQLAAANDQIAANATSITTASANFATANQRIAAAFGGGSSIDVNGIVTAPSYSVQGQTFNNAGAAFGALDTQVTSNTAAIASNTTSITNLGSQLSSGTIGIVRQDAVTRTVSVGKATDGTIVDFAGSAGSRKLTGVLSGTVSSSSTDAVNGAQLSATNTQVVTNTSAIASQATAMATATSNFATANQRIAAAFGGGSSVDANGIVTAPSYSVQGQTFNNVGAAFGALDTQVTSNTAAIASNTTSITNLGSQLSSGTIGIVRQDAVSRTVSVGKATDGTIVDFAGSAGSRKLTGVLSGTVSSSSTDAVNGAQLSATNTQVATNTSAIASQATAMATASSNFATANQRIAAAFGGGSSVDVNGIVTAPSYTVQGQTFNSIGGAFGALDTQVTSNTAAIANNTTSITNLGSQLSSGTIGIVRQDAVTRTVSVGKTTDGTVVDFTGSAGGRKLTGVLSGTLSSSSTDAVNGAQLAAANDQIAANATSITSANANFATANQRIAAAFGGGSSVDANGIVTAPSYSVQGQTFNNAGSAFSALDTQVTSNTAAIASNTTSITNLGSQLSSGTIGIVRQDAVSRTVSVGKTTDGTVVDFAGSAGSRKLTGVLSGTVSSSSTDAINGAQLSATNTQVAANTSAIASQATAMATASSNFATANQRIAAAFGGGSSVDANGIVTAPSYSVQGQTFNSIGGAFGALDGRVTSNTSDIAALNTQLSSGAVGLVRQDAGTRVLSIGATTDGSSVDMTGTGGARRLTGVLAGTLGSGSTDAVNGAQLAATNSQVAVNAAAISANSSAISAANANFATANQRMAAAFGGGSTVDANGLVTLPNYVVQGQAYGSVGGAIGALNAAAIGFRTDIDDISSRLNSGAIGLVRQASATQAITIGSGTGGTSINASGSAGARKLTGLLAGDISSGSSDAVTGSQFYSMETQVTANTQAIAQNATAISLGASNFVTANQRIAAFFGGGAAVDANGIVTAPSYSILGNSYGTVGNALAALNNRVETNSVNIANLMAGGGGSGGGSGFVTQDPSLRTINVATSTDGTTVNMAGAAGNRTVSGVAGGTIAAGSSDAVNGAQLAATNNAVASTAAYASSAASGVAAALGGGATVAADGTLTNPQYTIRRQAYGSVGGALSAVDTALSNDATNISTLTQSVQNITQRSRYMTVNGLNGPAVASGSDAVAMGSNSDASGTQAIAIGSGSSATRTGALAVGSAARATGVNAIAIGTNAVATGSVAVGVNAQASNGGAALGDNSIATAADSAALGPNATALGARSVAIGSGSVANEANVVSVGDAGATRRITNVSYGVAASDAVNVAQLTDATNQFQQQIDKLYGRTQALERDVQRNAGGVAMAMAMAGNALPQGKRFGFAMGVGTFAGQYAVGVSNFVRVSENIVLTSGVAFQEGNIGGRAGVMAAW